MSRPLCPLCGNVLIAANYDEDSIQCAECGEWVQPEEEEA